MSELLSTLSEEWAIRALIASSMVGIMCGMIGCFIVLRNMALIGDALAHATLPGVVFAFLLVGYSTLGFFIGSVIAGLITAATLTWIQHNVKTKNDASIGIVFTAMFAIGVVGISKLTQDQGVHLDLQGFLFGNVLGVTNLDLILTGVVLVYSLISVIIFYRYLFITTFQPAIAETMGISVKSIHYFLMFILSLAVVASLSTVGVILVVAMLITPASTALLLTDKLKRVLVYASLIGFSSAVLGLLAAILLNSTPGPVMVLTATLFYALAAVFAPQKGLISKHLTRRKQNKKIDQEDIIKALSKADNYELGIAEIASKIDLSKNRITWLANTLKKAGLIARNKDNTLTLSLKGQQVAHKLVRAHRLWETYQVNTMGIEDHLIHDEAERLEHVLTDELIDEVDLKLGYPVMDPHGSPIPAKKILPPNPLLMMRPKQRATIAKTQINDKIESELWELGLLPNSQVTILQIEKDSIKIKSGTKNIDIPAALAEKINVD